MLENLYLTRIQTWEIGTLIIGHQVIWNQSADTNSPQASFNFSPSELLFAVTSRYSDLETAMQQEQHSSPTVPDTELTTGNFCKHC